jgi:hypothetical protein
LTYLSLGFSTEYICDWWTCKDSWNEQQEKGNT